ncbi:MAG: PLP-dependent cysteine synthase family protein, partial [bacterium]
MDRNWTKLSVEKLEADFQRSSDTHLIPLPLPTFPDIHLYFK